MLEPPGMDALDAKMDRLAGYLRGLDSVLVCYSGGVDSAFVLAMAHRELGAKAIALTAVSPSLPPGELAEAQSLARQIGADHRVVSSNEMQDPRYVANGPDRCFYCKSELYDLAEKQRQAWGLASVLNGTNCDDLGDYRPGLQAASNAHVKSPLVDCAFDKADVRAGSRLLGLPVWDKPAAACLSSRIPYGTSVTSEKLAQIGGLESQLKQLGFRQVRVRYHDKLARIELDLQDVTRAAQPGIREKMVALGKQYGFQYVTLDLAGYRVGSHNEVIVGKSLRVL